MAAFLVPPGEWTREHQWGGTTLRYRGTGEPFDWAVGFYQRAFAAADVNVIEEIDERNYINAPRYTFVLDDFGGRHEVALTPTGWNNKVGIASSFSGFNIHIGTKCTTDRAEPPTASPGWCE